MKTWELRKISDGKLVSSHQFDNDWYPGLNIIKKYKKSGTEFYSVVREGKPATEIDEDLRQTKNVDQGNKIVTYSWEIIDASEEVTKARVYEQKVLEGYNVNPEGFTLALDAKSIADFTGLMTLLNEALDMGIIAENSPISIRDINGTPRFNTVARTKQILVGYGLYYKQLFDAK